jgi:hypothetical protein
MPNAKGKGWTGNPGNMSKLSQKWYKGTVAVQQFVAAAPV